MALHTIVEHDTTHIKPYIDKVKQALSNEVSARATLGAHNLGKKFNGVTYIGLTIKDAPDGGNYVNGTATGQGGRLTLKSDKFVLKAGTYSIVGESNDHSKYSSVVLQKASDSSPLGAYLISDGIVNKSQATVTLVEDTECFFGFNTKIDAAYGTDTFIIYPMVKLADDKDDTFYPYAMTNGELTKSVMQFTSVACAATTGNFATVSDSAITADHVVVDCVFASPSAITTDVTWTTSNGSLVLNGTCVSATTATITLARKGN